MKSKVLLIIGVLTMFLLLPNNTSLPVLHSGDRILAFGDSLTYGFGAAPQESYPARLAAATGITVINAGINGDTSSEGLRRLPALLQDGSIKLMLLCYGGNDILQRSSLKQLKQNLKAMILLARERGIAVVLISVPDIGILGLKPLSLYEEVATEMEVPLISGLLTDILEEPTLKSDQIHPNAAGYARFAREIEASLRQWGAIE